MCAKRVPDTSENEIAMNAAGDDIERDELVYSVNEPDNYAVEEALQIVGRAGGEVTVVTVGGEDDEEILRREMAMGANHGLLVSDEAFAGSDGRAIAAILAKVVEQIAEGRIEPPTIETMPLDAVSEALSRTLGSEGTHGKVVLTV